MYSEKLNKIIPSIQGGTIISTKDKRWWAFFSKAICFVSKFYIKNIQFIPSHTIIVTKLIKRDNTLIAIECLESRFFTKTKKIIIDVDGGKSCGHFGINFNSNIFHQHKIGKKDIAIHNLKEPLTEKQIEELQVKSDRMVTYAKYNHCFLSIFTDKLWTLLAKKINGNFTYNIPRIETLKLSCFSTCLYLMNEIILPKEEYVVDIRRLPVEVYNLKQYEDAVLVV